MAEFLKKIQKHEVGDLSILICLFMSNPCCQNSVISKTVAKSPALKGLSMWGAPGVGAWGFTRWERSAIPLLSAALWASLGRMNNSFSKWLTSPTYTSFCTKTWKPSEPWVQEMVRTLEMGSFFFFMPWTIFACFLKITFISGCLSSVLFWVILRTSK